MHFAPLAAGPPEDPTRFLPLLTVLALAFLVPLLLSRFRSVPVVVGEIVLGVVFGPSLLGWVTDGPILTFMSDIGLAFLMFLAGMEIDFNMLMTGSGKRKSGPNILGLSLALYVATLGLAVVGTMLAARLGLEGDFWLLTFVLSATSLGVLLPILKDRGLMQTTFGRIVFLSAMLADFITVILLTIYLITLDQGLDPQIFALGLLFLAFLIFYRWGPSLVRIDPISNLIERLSGATVQIKVRGAVTILMAFVVLAEFVNAELILGAFLAGMIISLLRRPQDDGLIHNLEAFGFGFFIPIFFIMVGVDLNIQSLLAAPETLLAIPGFFLIALVVKLAPMLLVKRHFSWKELLAGGLLLNTHLSLEVAVAVIGLRAGLLTEATSTAIILLAVLTVLTMPVIFNAVAPSSPKKEKPFKLFLGASDLAVHVAEQLRAHNDTVRFLITDPEENGFLKNKSFEVLDGGVDALPDLSSRPIQSLLILHEDDLKNLGLARQACQAGLKNIIVQVRDPQLMPEFEKYDVTTFSPALQRPTMISMMARNPNILDLLTTTTDNRQSLDVQVRNPRVIGKNLRELKLPGDLLILAIRRGSNLVIPRGGTSFERLDRVSILGNIDDIQAVQTLFEGEPA